MSPRSAVSRLSQQGSLSPWENRASPGTLAVGGGLIGFDVALVTGYTAYLRRIGM
ncbi:hypothetical protein ACQF36_44465 [Streptomyces sp. Marseille-Q5077]|uniref:hypothetical protein n=1 Tax=Streptomyces sp. Marseille-Q5077 TaxID=3418995 RepID=UPI003D06A1EB